MLILGKNAYFEAGYKQNANTMLIGAPGTGKSRSFVIPNLCEAQEESLVVLDAKGEIYDITHKMMEQKGYRVRVLDFDKPEQSGEHYNPLTYCRTEEDILKFSSILTQDLKEHGNDIFWPLTSQLLNNSLTSYLISFRPEHQQNLRSLMKLLAAAHVDENDPDGNRSKLDNLFNEVSVLSPQAWCLSQYALMKNAAGRTQRSIVISLTAEFCSFMTPQIAEMTAFNSFNLADIGEEKTILYVKCSDVDRSKDKLVSLFFTQLFQELFLAADRSPQHGLARPVHVILDDMGSNVKIPNLDCIIACARGRNISLSLILQSIGQLKKNYTDHTSILNSCNNMVFLGGNDLETCNEISLRLNCPLEDVLYKPAEQVYIFRQGAAEPLTTEVYDVHGHPNYPMLCDNWRPACHKAVGEGVSL